MKTPGSVTIVTPCWNAGDRLGRTIRSILQQRALERKRLRLQYVICDGGSTDSTFDVVSKTCGEETTLISEPDGGMYDALAKGLRIAQGDIVAYLNAGDEYFPGAFDIVADVMASGRGAWVTGMKVLLNERGDTTTVATPFLYRRRLVKKGVYGRVLPFIQQESTFWSGDLTRLIDFERLRRLKFAGDYYIWTCLAREVEPVIVEGLLGAFLVHAGQKSEDMQSYREEMTMLCGRLGIADLALAAVDAALWWAPPTIRRVAAGRRLVRWSRVLGRWV